VSSAVEQGQERLLPFRLRWSAVESGSGVGHTLHHALCVYSDVCHIWILGVPQKRPLLSCPCPGRSGQVAFLWKGLGACQGSVPPSSSPSGLTVYKQGSCRASSISRPLGRLPWAAFMARAGPPPPRPLRPSASPCHMEVEPRQHCYCVSDHKNNMCAYSC
jgi:hypothetical protein